MGLSVRLEMSARWARCLFVYLGRGRWMRAFREMTKCLCLSQGGWPVLRPGRKGAKRRPLSRSSWPSAQEPGSEGSARSERGGACCRSPERRVSRGAGQGAPGAPLIPVAAAQPSWGLRGQRVPACPQLPPSRELGPDRLRRQGKKQRPSWGAWAPASGPMRSAFLNRAGEPYLRGPQTVPAGRVPEVRSTPWLIHALVHCLIHPGAWDSFPGGARGQASPLSSL